MATFMTDLWTSVFTPGPTPTLLLATNATFAALQLLLFTLLVATYSIHFIILSLLCAGLWISINWFARELLVAQAEAEREKQRGTPSKSGKDSRAAGAAGDGAEGDDERGAGTETETEVEGEGLRRSLRVRQRETVTPEPSVGKASGRETGEVEKRKGRELSGEVSTDSEWEKIEGEK